MFDLSGKFSEFKDKMLGKKKAEKEETPAPLTDHDYIREAAWLMRRIVNDSRVNIAEGRQNDRRLLAAYCYGALAEFDRDHGERAELVHSAMYHMLTRKFHFSEDNSIDLIKQLKTVRERSADGKLLQMIRRGEQYYELLRQGEWSAAVENAAAAFRVLLSDTGLYRPALNNEKARSPEKRHGIKFSAENIYIAAPGRRRIREFEKAHGIEFPQEYIRFLKAHNGATPVKCGFICGNTVYYVEQFLPLLDKDTLEEMEWTEDQETLKKLLPLEMDAVIQKYADRITDDLDLEEMYYIPIALLSGGNLACLDFGVYPAQPAVCIWLEEESSPLYPVFVEAAECFREFLDQLYTIGE